MRLTIAYVTARDHPELDWFLQSLANEVRPNDQVHVLIVDSQNRSDDLFTQAHKAFNSLGAVCPIIEFGVIHPKPNYWQGKHRLTAENWWAVANARNTAICQCITEWISFVDDRSVLLPGWLDAVKEAMAGNYIVAGAYQKRTGMTVENGFIKNGGIVTGEDSREQHVKAQGFKTPWPCPGQWLFGCNLALPLEWALQVNGYSETLTDGLSFEDVPFGLVLANNEFPIKFDPRMKIIEDRTPELCGPVLRRTDRGVSPKDKSHKVLELIAKERRSPNPFDLRQMRQHVLATGKYPAPSGPTTDWWDGTPIADFVFPMTK